MERIEIPLSKSKNITMLIGSIGFVAIGIWFITNPPHSENSFWGDPGKLKVIGYLSILFFGFTSIVLFRKLFDKKPGLIIDEKGITDNSSGVSAGEIAWSDIEKITVIQIQKQNMLLVHVSNPKEYIEKQKGSFKKHMMEMNYKLYQTPLSITPNTLQISFSKLSKLLSERLENSKKNNG